MAAEVFGAVGGLRFKRCGERDLQAVTQLRSPHTGKICEAPGVIAPWQMVGRVVHSYDRLAPRKPSSSCSGHRVHCQARLSCCQTPERRTEHPTTPFGLGHTRRQS